MPESLLTLLKVCLLLLLYLFFLRVLRAVTAEVKGPRTTPAAATKKPNRRERKAASAAHRQLVVLAPPEQKGRIYGLTDELTVGRAAGCQVTIEDTYVSQVHARVFNRDEQWLVEDLGSTNGTYLNRTRVSRPTVMKPGDKLQVGDTVMELA